MTGKTSARMSKLQLHYRKSLRTKFHSTLAESFRPLLQAHQLCLLLVRDFLCNFRMRNGKNRHS